MNSGMNIVTQQFPRAHSAPAKFVRPGGIVESGGVGRRARGRAKDAPTNSHP